MVRLAKNRTNAKQHPEVELFLKKVEHSSSTLSSKSSRTHSKK